MEGRRYAFAIDPVATETLARAVRVRRGGALAGVVAAMLALGAAAAAAWRADLAWAPVALLLGAALVLAWAEARARRGGPLTRGAVRARIGPEGVDWQGPRARLRAGWSAFAVPVVAGGDVLLPRGPDDALPLPRRALPVPATEAADKVRAWIARREGGAPLDLAFDLGRPRARWARAVAPRAPLAAALVALAAGWALLAPLAPVYAGWDVSLRLAALGGPVLALLLLAALARRRARERARLRAPVAARRWVVDLSPEGLRAEAPDLALEASWSKGMRAVAAEVGVALALDGQRVIPIPARALGDRTPREVAQVVNRWIRRASR